MTCPHFQGVPIRQSGLSHAVRTGSTSSLWRTTGTSGPRRGNRASTVGAAGWYMIGGASFPPGAPVYAVSRSIDKLDIFAADVNGNILTSAWEPGFTQWRPWRQVAGASLWVSILAPTPRHGSRTSARIGTAGGRSGTPPSIRLHIGRSRPRRFPQHRQARYFCRRQQLLDSDFSLGARFHAMAAVAPGGERSSLPGSHVTAVSRSTDKLDIFVVSPNFEAIADNPAGTVGLVFTAAPLAPCRSQKRYAGRRRLPQYRQDRHFHGWRSCGF